jgi:EAL domain-containing protein (putative c-di-GMP-specific phosphodiesterase class I)/CHASE2 domain-containing sensor protein
MAGARTVQSGSRYGHLAIALIAAILVGLTGLVGPLNGLIWATQARVAQHQASGDIVYIGVESDLSDTEKAGMRHELADTVDRLAMAGAKRVYLDFLFEGPTSAAADEELQHAVHDSGITTLVDRFSTRGGLDRVLTSVPAVADDAPVAVRKEWVDLWGYTWSAPYTVKIGKRVWPSFPAALAGVNASTGGDFYIDYSTSFSSIPSFTLREAKQLLADPPRAETFRGKTIVVGALPGNGVSATAVPGFPKIPESYIGIYGAETLLHGPLHLVKWYVPLAIMAIVLAGACIFNSSPRRRAVYAGTFGVLIVLFMGGIWFRQAIEFSEALSFLAIFCALRLVALLQSRVPLIDGLSGLPTFAKLERDFANGKVDTRQALVVAKIHRFDEVLASLPPAQHGKYLQLIASRLMVTDETATAYSSGGRYFAWMQSYEDRGQLQAHLRGLRAIFSSAVKVDGQAIDVGITFGADTGEEDVSKRLSSAMAAVDKTNEANKPVILAELASDADRLFNISLQSRIDEALKSNEIYLVYQPQFEVFSGRLIGAEALARWNDPERGNIPPSYFIEQCELVGRMDALTGKVFSDAISTVSSSKFVESDFNLSVNVSATMLGDFDIVRLLERSLKHSRLKRQNLTIEITETARIEDIETAAMVMAAMRDLGVRLSADDFGVGAASFEPFLQLPFDELKIDRLFVSRLVNDKKARKIVENLVNLGRDLDVRVLAEGVEDEVTFQMLRELGCPAAQGFKLGMPMTFAELSRLFLSDKSIAKQGDTGT